MYLNVFGATDALQHIASLLQVAPLDQRVGRLWQRQPPCSRCAWTVPSCTIDVRWAEMFAACCVIEAV